MPRRTRHQGLPLEGGATAGGEVSLPGDEVRDRPTDADDTALRLDLPVDDTVTMASPLADYVFTFIGEDAHLATSLAGTGTSHTAARVLLVRPNI